MSLEIQNIEITGAPTAEDLLKWLIGVLQETLDEKGILVLGREDMEHLVDNLQQFVGNPAWNEWQPSKYDM